HRMHGGRSYGQVVIDDDGFRELLEAQGLDNSSIERAMSVLRHFVGMVSEMSDEIKSGQIYNNATAQSYNVIPSDESSGMCTDLVVALASSKGHPKNRFLNVMREVRAHLIQCMHSTEVVFILTDVWDPVKFRESKADLRAHIGRGVKLIPGLVNEGRLIPLALPFDD
ncbi:MAG: hypothetical protein OSB34_11485, partial [Planktomarina sp.]|nr:hypothetical protein [Planktomarina sp.]